MNNRAAVRLFIFYGPTTVDRGTVVGSLYERYPSRLYLSVSITTRQSHPGEAEGKSYFFASRGEFQGFMDSGGMLEWAEVHQQNLYGTPAKPVDEASIWGLPVLLEIDSDGFRRVKAVKPETHSIFLLPPSWKELKRCLIGYGAESTEEQHCYLEVAWVELTVQSEFDELIASDNLVDAVSALAKSMGLA